MNRSQKIHKKQYLRYMKTYIWAIKTSQEEIQKCIIVGSIKNYPVDSTTLEDAINAIETKEGLRETKISLTDLYAIKEAMNHKQD